MENVYSSAGVSFQPIAIIKTEHLIDILDQILKLLRKLLLNIEELRVLSAVTLNCLVAKIVMNSGSQLSEL